MFRTGPFSPALRSLGPSHSQYKPSVAAHFAAIEAPFDLPLFKLVNRIFFGDFFRIA